MNRITWIVILIYLGGLAYLGAEIFTGLRWGFIHGKGSVRIWKSEKPEMFKDRFIVLIFLFVLLFIPFVLMLPKLIQAALEATA